jgi:4-hydroxy-3-methylbut-2-en-1-yl diphosphate reductase
MLKPILNIILAKPRGFCAGVERAVATVENALIIYGKPIYVRHEIVHNKYVVDSLKEKGAIFIQELSEVPEGNLVIFSAHGVAEKIEAQAKARNLKIIDATCPLVTKVHLEAKRHEKNNRQIILIGHPGHPEVEGTSGRVKSEVLIVSNILEAKNLEVSDPNNLAYVTQTTLSVNDTANIIKTLTDRFPNIIGPNLNDICYATQNRQNSVSKMSDIIDILFVIGAKNSSNSNRLKDLGEEKNINSYLIDNENDIKLEWLKNKKILGITAGASAPDILVENVITFLKKYFEITIKELEGIEENIHFKLPKEVSDLC